MNTHAKARRLGLTHGTGIRVLFIGVLFLLVGFSWDAVQHYLDEQLAARESILTIANPSHLFIMIGVALTCLGLLLQLIVQARTSVRHKVPYALAAACMAMAGVGAGAIAMLTFDGAGHTHGPTSIFQASEVDLAASSLALTTRLDGLAIAINQLRVLADRSPSISASGHALAHALGQYAATIKGNDPQVFSECSEIFSSGCYHGVVEAYFQAQKSLTPDVVVAFCSNLVDEVAALLTECAHGVGHGLTGQLSHNIFAALPFCDSFPSVTLRRECTDGVFMENVVHSVNVMNGSAAPGLASEHTHAAGHKAYYKRNDPQYPCDAVATDLQSSCYHYQNVLLTAYFGIDSMAVLGACDAAPTSGIGECYRGYGKNLSVMGSLDWATEQCLLGTTTFAENCISGIVEQLVDASMNDTSALVYCETMSNIFADECYREVDRRVVYLGLGSSTKP